MGDNICYMTGNATLGGQGAIPAYRVSIATTTTVYLQEKTVSGAGNCYGRISARRVR